MATKKKDNYIVYELEFLEKKAEELKQYVEANPFDKLKDRIHWKETKSGGAIPMVTASIEAQLKSLTQALKDYADLIARIDLMRQKEEEKQKNVRGHQALSPAESGMI